MQLEDQTTETLLVIRAKQETALQEMTASIQKITAIIEERMAQAERDMMAKDAAVSADAAQAVPEKPERKKRHLGVAARKRIAAAQRRRWAEYKKRKQGR